MLKCCRSEVSCDVLLGKAGQFVFAHGAAGYPISNHELVATSNHLLHKAPRGLRMCIIVVTRIQRHMAIQAQFVDIAR